jgi:thiamine pyrophosphate-dependent acetolactate synthase large subunit-like protein
VTRANAPLDRRAVVKALLAERGGLLVVCGAGTAVYDAAAAGDHPLTFPMWGAMGGAAMVGLGVALAQPGRPVLVLTGDGEMLMAAGSLATVGVKRPANLTLAVLDNERYAETGMQATHTAHGINLAALAAACGFKEGAVVRDMAGVEKLKRRLAALDGPHFAQIKVAQTVQPPALPPREGRLLKNRFRAALLGPRAALD